MSIKGVKKCQLTLTLTLTIEDLFLYKSTILLGKKLLLRWILEQIIFPQLSKWNHSGHLTGFLWRLTCSHNCICCHKYYIADDFILSPVWLLVICQHKFRGNEARPPHWHQASVQGNMVIWYQIYSQEFFQSRWVPMKPQYLQRPVLQNQRQEAFT